MKIEEMEVFKKSHELVLYTYKITKDLPDDERFTLINQMRRSSASIATNLVEGDSRYSKKEYEYFLKIAIGSCAELRYQYLLCHDLGYINYDEKIRAFDLCKDTMNLLVCTKKSVEARND